MASHTYNSSKQDLCIMARTAWHSCSTYRTAFAEFSQRYTQAYINNAIAQINQAEQALSKEKTAQLLYVQLVAQAKTACSLWQLLKRYIKKAFPPAEQQIQLSAAGQHHYRNASRKNWGDCTQLLNNAKAYITNHQAQLLANNNMSPAFPLTFSTEVANYTNLLSQYHEAAGANPVSTQQKIVAVNTIQKQLMSMLLDGQRIFKKNPAVKKLFTFDQLRRTLTHHSTTTAA